MTTMPWNDPAGANLPRASQAMPWLVHWLPLVLLLWYTAAIASTDIAAPGQFSIQIDGEHLTVLAQEVPQQQILAALAHRLDFDLILMGPLPEPRSFLIEGRHWEQTLKQVLSPASWALHYARVAGEDRLVQVVVFPAASPPQQERRVGDAPVERFPPQPLDAEPPEATKEDQALPAEMVELEGTDSSGQHTQEAESHVEPDYDKSATSQ